jgi:glyceraldehyde 3-phosphate dehydrogenase
MLNTENSLGGLTMTVKVGINGFGRIGRNAFKVMVEKYGNEIEVVGINDLTDSKTLAHLLKYDSCFGKFDGEVSYGEDNIVVNGKSIRIYKEKDPAVIPWKECGAEIIIECTGRFTKKADAEKH